MKSCAESHARSKDCLPERELTEERFLEQFAALEDGLDFLQLQMRSMAENVKLFGSFVRHMRQSTSPASLGTRNTAVIVDNDYPTTAEIVQPKTNYRHPK
jgi:hypothetical protein